MLDAALFRALFDVKCFDLHGVNSCRRNASHMAMSASMYVNPHNRGAIVSQLDAMILGATQVNLDFNVNVTSGTDGLIMGVSGGHVDAAAGVKPAGVTTRLNAGGTPKIVDRLTTVTTPGETVDVIMTKGGVAVNPKREDLREKLRSRAIPAITIEQLKEMAERGVSKRSASAPKDRFVAVVKYRDGTVIDLIQMM